MVLCSSRDGVPLKLKKENGRPGSLNTYQLVPLSTPVSCRWRVPLRMFSPWTIHLKMAILKHSHLENNKENGDLWSTFSIGTSQHQRENGDKIPVSEMAKKWSSFCKPERNGQL